MDNEFKNKVAVITGAGRGIGRAIAMQMALKGAKIVVNDYGSGPDGSGASSVYAEEVAEEIRRAGGEAVSNGDTVATEEGGTRIIDTAIETFGRIDILVNNAGIVMDRMIFNLTENEWDLVLKVNLYGQFYCTRAATRIMRKNNWGRIINMSSGAGLGRTAGCANYAAAKEGVIGFTRAVARDMSRYGVTCNAIRPLALTRHFDEERKQAWVRQGKTRDIEEMENSRPEDVAAFVLYLASEEAKHITGRTFFVGGGIISLYSEPERIKTIERGDGWNYGKFSHIIPSDSQ
ncbi:MAG TPA: SDR family oxidoreductase [Desulfobacteraceae bacterium]|nr:SDR family oxidoreductase [Desulfobacteraceae bacterium]HPJ67632.1 SDR family oxidoreductase [Desulfobacteraceae bacterium]